MKVAQLKTYFDYLGSQNIDVDNLELAVVTDKIEGGYSTDRVIDATASDTVLGFVTSQEISDEMEVLRDQE